MRMKIPKSIYMTVALVTILLVVTGQFSGSLILGAKNLSLELKELLGVQEEPQEETTTETPLSTPAEEVTEVAGKSITYLKDVRPIMEKYCFGCHDEDLQRGGVQLDNLNPDFVDGPDAESWHTALDQINAGAMPPEGKRRYTDEERRILVDWITASLEEAAKVKNEKNNKNRANLRRLTKAQYTNSLKDILGLDIDFGKSLPNDGKSKMGFTNNASVLQVSPLHIDYYQKIAREALGKAIVYGEKPATTHYKVSIEKGVAPAMKGGSFGGFQTVIISPEDFKVDMLDNDGNIITAAQDNQLARKISSVCLDMRGSDRNRFSIDQFGMTLYSSLPNKELPPKSWQGPSPNLKMLIKNNFPSEGRVR